MTELKRLSPLGRSKIRICRGRLSQRTAKRGRGRRLRRPEKASQKTKLCFTDNKAGCRGRQPLPALSPLCGALPKGEPLLADFFASPYCFTPQFCILHFAFCITRFASAFCVLHSAFCKTRHVFCISLSLAKDSLSATYITTR